MSLEDGGQYDRAIDLLDEEAHRAMMDAIGLAPLPMVPWVGYEPDLRAFERLVLSVIIERADVEGVASIGDSEIATRLFGAAYSAFDTRLIASVLASLKASGFIVMEAFVVGYLVTGSTGAAPRPLTYIEFAKQRLVDEGIA